MLSHMNLMNIVTPLTHYCVHKRPLLALMLSQMNPVNVVTSYFKPNFFSHKPLTLPNGHFPSGYPTKMLYARYTIHVCVLYNLSTSYSLITTLTAIRNRKLNSSNSKARHCTHPKPVQSNPHCRIVLSLRLNRPLHTSIVLNILENKV
jgi:hypothetical protein